MTSLRDSSSTTTPGRTGPRYDPQNGTLVATADVIRALASGRPSVRLLDELGATRDGVVHERLGPTLSALRDPVHGTLQLAYKGKSLDGWRGADAVALLTPPDDRGLHTLAQVPAERLPVALARVAAVTVRPNAAGPTTTKRLRAARDVVRWWRLLHGPTGESPGGLLEVVDTLSGIFLVGHDESAIPTDAPSVEHLIRWLCAGREVLQPLRPLPPGAALPEAAPESADPDVTQPVAPRRPASQ